MLMLPSSAPLRKFVEICYLYHVNSSKDPHRQHMTRMFRFNQRFERFINQDNECHLVSFCGVHFLRSEDGQNIGNCFRPNLRFENQDTYVCGSNLRLFKSRFGSLRSPYLVSTQRTKGENASDTVTNHYHHHQTLTHSHPEWGYIRDRDREHEDNFWPEAISQPVFWPEAISTNIWLASRPSHLVARLIQPLQAS